MSKNKGGFIRKVWLPIRSYNNKAMWLLRASGVFYFFIIPMLLACVGCTRISMQITTYYNPSIQFSGKSYAFYPIEKLHQNKDNQYDYFTYLLAQKFALKGMKQTTLSRADYGIILYYWIGQGENKTDYYPMIGQTGSELKSSYSRGTAYNYGNYGYYAEHTSYNSKPVYGVVGYVPYQYTVYPYFIQIFIMKKGNLQKGKPLYYASLVSTNGSVSSDIVFNTMLKGYLDIFPGINGQTRRMILYVDNH